MSATHLWYGEGVSVVEPIEYWAELQVARSLQALEWDNKKNYHNIKKNQQCR